MELPFSALQTATGFDKFTLAKADADRLADAGALALSYRIEVDPEAAAWLAFVGGLGAILGAQILEYRRWKRQQPAPPPATPALDPIVEPPPHAPA